MKKVFPPKLKVGDEIRVIAPAKSMGSMFIEKKLDSTVTYFKENFGVHITLGKHIFELNELETASLDHRLEDFHAAFKDKNVKAILTVLGGASSNQMLKHIDYDLTSDNPKIFCGLSDITALTNGIYAKTGLITYSGPHFTVFGHDKAREYTADYFRKCFFENETISIASSPIYFDERKGDAENITNDGWWIIEEGEATGTALGGNLITFNLLQGTEYFPVLSDSILFIEDNNKESSRAFENHLQSLILQPSFKGVKGLVIGRFQQGSGLSKELLAKIIKTKPELEGIPIVANVDFGHTLPMITFPTGGKVQVDARGKDYELKIIEH
mgnify:CR=1 FL=1